MRTYPLNVILQSKVLQGDIDSGLTYGRWDHLFGELPHDGRVLWTIEGGVVTFYYTRAA